MISVPVSIGEMIDKLSILHVKKIKVSNEEKLNFINTEFELLYNMSSFYLDDSEVSKLYHQLVDVNLKLWEIEDEIRVLESNKDFGVNFIELARKVYHTNDDRFSLKDKINEITNSTIREQKDYIEYK